MAKTPDAQELNRQHLRHGRMPRHAGHEHDGLWMMSLAFRYGAPLSAYGDADQSAHHQVHATNDLLVKTFGGFDGQTLVDGG